MARIKQCGDPLFLDLGCFAPCSDLILFPLTAHTTGVYRFKYSNRDADQWIEYQQIQGEYLKIPKGKINESFKGFISIYTPDGKPYKSKQFLVKGEVGCLKFGKDVCFEKFKIEMRFAFINRDIKDIGDLIFGSTDDKEIGEIKIDEFFTCAPARID